MEIYFRIYKKYLWKELDQEAHTQSMRVGGMPPRRAPTLWAPRGSTDITPDSIYSLSGRTK